MIATLLGGLTFFLFGMNVMSGGLEEMAGGGLERTLKKVTKNDIAGFGLGAGITVAIQSSSAMTVMLVGLVNSGLLAFEDTFGIIMGSHVGTTLTSWILTLNANTGKNFFLVLLKPLTFSPILAFIGIALRMLAKSTKKKRLGDIFIGFAILMAGMDMMSASMANVKQYAGILTVFSNYPIIAFLVSTAFTGVIQSSAATVAIVQALAISSVSMDFKAAIPLVIGANIGTCMTALISSVGTNKNAKRVVAMHIFTNAIGGIVCMIAMYIVMFFSPDLLTKQISIIGVAVVHSLFNIINTIAFVPFKRPMIKLCEKVVKKDTDKTHTIFLDERIFNNTTLAISECRRLLNEMAELSRVSIQTSVKLLTDYNEEESKYVVDAEDLTDKYEDKLGAYLVRLSTNELSNDDSYTVGRMLHAIGDFERIGDHSLNIRDLAEEMHEKKISFSAEALKELDNINSAIIEILSLTIDSFLEDDTEKSAYVEPLEQVIDEISERLRALHIERLQHGECTVELGFIFTDLLMNIERVSDHCSNIAAYTLQIDSHNLDTHKYLNKIKVKENKEFQDKFEMFEKKYIS